jgi:hypothetical protein
MGFSGATGVDAVADDHVLCGALSAAIENGETLRAVDEGHLPLGVECCANRIHVLGLVAFVVQSRHREIAVTVGMQRPLAVT